MKQGIFIIKENTRLAGDLYKLVLSGDTAAVARPGQFIDIRLDGHYLRRPISVCDWDEASVTVIYKLLGRGTGELSRYPASKALDVLTGLGNGFDTGVSGPRPLLVGGGVGIPPLYRLAKELLKEGKKPGALFGFNRREDLFLMDEFRALGLVPIIATADGSCGVRGFVTDALQDAGTYSYVYACGPAAMLKALDALVTTGAQYSFEERMGCGFGACMGCTVETESGPKRVCRDGPVFERGELLW